MVMIITTLRVLPIRIQIKENGKVVDRKTIMTRPGSYNYQEVDPSDPFVAQQLFSYRKHKAIAFSELLPQDAEVIRGVRKARPSVSPEEVAQELKKSQSLKDRPQAVGAKNEKKAKAKKAKKVTKKSVDSRRAKGAPDPTK
jgi:hypothetical protein